MASVATGKLLADRYRVIGRLGAGGMAVVVLAQDERLGRKVAIKRLHAEMPGDAARRFDREAKLGASLNHPNIVAVYDVDCDEESVLIVMEYVDGYTLRNEMDRGPMAPARAIEVLSGMAAGLDHAHAQGVVHRDVKPANVLIARDDRVKITDLGIATAAERTNITRSGTVLGTAAYMAPERLDGHAGGPAVDVYALAAVAFEALSGRKAVTGKTAMEVARRVIEEPPADLAALVPGTPRRVAEALKRGLAKDPDARPASAGELVRELAAAYAEDVTAGTQALPGAAAAAAVPVAAATVEPPRDEPVAEPPALAPPEPEPVAAAPAAEPPRREPVPAAEPTRHRGRPAWAVPAALALAMAVLAVGIVVLASSGGGTDNNDAGSQSAASKSEQSGDGAGESGGSSTTDPGSGSATDPGSAGSDAGTPATPSQEAADPSTPAGALQSLYTRAADDDFDGAWALGTDRLHNQFGSLGKFEGTFSTLESIDFPKLETAGQSGSSATVEYSTVARHTDHTDRCTAKATLVKQGEGWLVDHLDTVDCKSS